MELLVNRKLTVNIGFSSFVNFVNEFNIKIDNLVSQVDKETDIDINLHFPKFCKQEIDNFGKDHIIFILRYLYVMKHLGHPDSQINIIV